MSLSVGKIFGIEVRLHYTWFIIFMLVTWTLAADYVPNQFPGLPTFLYWLIGAVSALILFVSVLLHELSHSVVAIRRGLSVPRITLHIFGGVSQLADEPQKPGTELRMAIVGPLSSFALSALFAGGWVVATYLNLGAVIVAPLNYASLINLLLGGFNLLPALPLDGGRVLRAGIWKWKKDLLDATRLSAKIGVGIAYGMMGFGFILMLFGAWLNGLWLIFIGWFIKSDSNASLRQTIVSEALSDVSVEEIMSSQVVAVSPVDSIEEIVQEYFYNYKHGGFPVVENGQLLGMITMHDLREVPKEKRAQTKVKEVMTSKEKLIFVKPNEPAIEALVKLSRRDVGRVPVVENERLVGILTRSDLLRAIRARTEL